MEKKISQNDFSYEKPLKTPKSVGVIYTRKTRWILFLLLMSINLVINMDHGTIPAATTEIKRDLNIDNDTLGVFGSLVYLGNLLGSMFFFTIIGTSNRKWITVLCLLLISLSLLCFTIVRIIYVLFINRVVTGFFQAFITIYFPVWCDQFGPKKHKALMMALLQLGVPLGVVFGYILTSFIKQQLGWFYTFYIQLAIVAVFSFVLSFCPMIYFSGIHFLENKKASIIEKKRSKISISLRNTSYYDDISVFKENVKPMGGKKNICSNIKLICGNCLFLFSVFSVSILFFIITAIQFWVSDYLLNVLHISEEIVTISFMITCVTSPTLGILFGGVIFNKLGGPESKYSSMYVLLLGILAFAASVPVPFVDDIYLFTLFLWLVLFFGGAIMPNLTGIIISSLPQNFRTYGNSLSNFFSNLIGYLPAPFVYGMISKYFPAYPRLPLIITLYLSLVGVVFMALAAVEKCRLHKKTELSKNLINEGRRTIITNMNAKASLIAVLWGNKDLEFDKIEDNVEENFEEEEDSSADSEGALDKADSIKLVIKESNKNEKTRAFLSSSFIEKRSNECEFKEIEVTNPKTY